MINKKEIDWTLYAIIDYEWIRERTLKRLVEEIIRGGATVIQYRNKCSVSRLFYFQALQIREVTKIHHIPLIINDRLDIALAVQADGIHLGQNDLPILIARQIAGEELIIGISVSSIAEFTAAKKADYFGVGSIYSTHTKENVTISGINLIGSIRNRTKKPVIGIGGITAENLSPIFTAGGDGIAVISAILDSNDILFSTKKLVNKIRTVRSDFKKGLKNDFII